MRRTIPLLLLLTAVVGVLVAQPRRTGIAYCDVDHLYDTLPSLFYNDDDFTSTGKLRWNTERYLRKVQQTVEVIDSMALPITILWGVETEAVVRDLVSRSKQDYTYLHRTLNSLDGMDFALLYWGDRFFPHYEQSGRRYLYVEGRLGRDTVGIVLCSEARMAAWVVRDLRDERPGVRLVVAGRSEGIEAERYGLCDPLGRSARAGQGNIRSRSGWLMRDRILVDTALQVVRSGVYARRYLVDQKSGNPLPTYDRRQYRGGYSYAFPVFVYLE